MSEFYRELRCMFCHKLICFEYIFEGRLKFVCPRCSEVSVFKFKHRASAKNATIASGEQNNNINA